MVHENIILLFLGMFKNIVYTIIGLIHEFMWESLLNAAIMIALII